MSKDSKPTIITDPPGRAVEKYLRDNGCLPSETCYTTMDTSTLLQALGDDASKWAAAWCQHARKLQNQGKPIIDEGWMISWFANAIEHSCDTRRWRKEGIGIPSNPAHLQ